MIVSRGSLISTPRTPVNVQEFSSSDGNKIRGQGQKTERVSTIKIEECSENSSL
jgi:hypothetical protein